VFVKDEVRIRAKLTPDSESSSSGRLSQALDLHLFSTGSRNSSAAGYGCSLKNRYHIQRGAVRGDSSSLRNAMRNPDQSFQLILDGCCLIFSAIESFQTLSLGEGGKHGRK